MSASSAVPKRKLVIKPFKSQPQIPPHFEETTWAKLQLALDAIHHKTSVVFSKEELCQAVEDACMHRLGSGIYARLSEHCRKHINAKVDSMKDQALSEPSFLLMVVNVWTEHSDCMSTIRNIFIHLDRAYAADSSSLPTVLELGTNYFKLRLEQNKELERKIISSAIMVIESERYNYLLNPDLNVEAELRMLGGAAIVPCSLSFLNPIVSRIGIYLDKFEVPFIQQSRAFFLSDAQKKLPNGGEPGAATASLVCDYLSHVEMRLQQAAEMCVYYLDICSKKPLTAMVEECLIRPHVALLVDLGLNGMLDLSLERLADLKRLFHLLDRVQAVDLIKTGFVNYIKMAGDRIINNSAGVSGTSDKSNPDTMIVENLIVFLDRMKEVTSVAFQNSESFQLALKSAFQQFINAHETPKRSKPAELICKFIDKKLCGGDKRSGLGEAEMEALLDKVLLVFKFLQGQDVFEAHYKKTLARRLLLETSCNIDLESFIIRKLKMECGGNFTAKLEGMMKDMELSKDTVEDYQVHVSTHPLPVGNAIDAKIQVLTVGYWPTYPALSFAIPECLLASQQHFSAFYTEKYNGRRLEWVPFLARCILGATLARGKKEFDVPLSQAVVMLAFNNMTTMTFEQIAKTSQLDKALLKVCLHTLSCGPPVFRLLEKEPRNNEISETDTFTLMMSYSNKMFRIRYRHQELKDSSKEDAETQQEVFRERHNYIDAAIVRIMKSRKRLGHQTLISEVLSQLRFPCVATDVKRRIETLIEREYVARDEADNSTYTYLA